MIDKNSKNYVVTRNEDESRFDPNEGSLYIVDSMNWDKKINVFLRHDGGVVSEFEGYGERDDWGDYETVYIKAECQTYDDFKSYLNETKLTLPAGFLKGMASGTLPASENYDPVLSDITALKGKPFVANWSLSYESADDDENELEVSTLSEAMEIIAKSGAMQAIPGNYSSIRVGSLELCHTVFRSDGIDRGDSHINPRVNTEDSSLFTAIIEHEQKQKKDLEARVQRRNQQNASNNFSL